MIPGALPAVLRYTIEVTTRGHDGQPLARYDVLLTCADHLVVGLHELPAFVPNPQEVPRAA